jgi:predicted MFS family arabinose efflux permease
MLVVGWLVYAVIYLAFAWATTAWQAWMFLLKYALFYGLTEPAEKTLVAALIGPEHKGLAFGWFHFAIGAASLPSSWIFGILYEEYGALVAFGWGAGLAFLAAPLLLGVRTPARLRES